MRVSLPGYDCLTDGTIDHYSIYADSDNILIKEQTRGTIVVPGFDGSVAHNLGYIPFYLVYGETSSGNYQLVNSFNIYADWQVSANTTHLLFSNRGSGSVATYYIFYDNLEDI